MTLFRNNLELILGPVCSGKSAELIRRIDRLNIAGFELLLLKPKIDTRSSYVSSRNGSKLKCVEIDGSSNVFDATCRYALENNSEIDIVAFDEAQFFPNLFSSVKDLLDKGFKVLVSALDTDFNGEPFGDVIKLVTLSDTVTKLTAICMRCKGDYAIFSQKLKKGGEIVEIGDLELYQPRCLNCFVPGGINGEEV